MTAEQAPALEAETCSRCGGSGHYSYCQMYGTRCFKCAGRKVVLTKRGAAAAAYLETLRCKPAADVQVGETIRYGAITGTGTPYNIWVKVVRITPIANINEGRRSFIDGVEQVLDVAPGLQIEGTDKTGMTCRFTARLADPVRIAQTAEQKRATLLKAVEYQATLTKAGTPRKR